MFTQYSQFRYIIGMIANTFWIIVPVCSLYLNIDNSLAENVLKFDCYIQGRNVGITAGECEFVLPDQ
jgi:hypothetical protein